MKSLKDFTMKSQTKLDALTFIKKAHSGQKYGSEPYWTHPKAVADKGKELFGAKFNSTVYIAALLHDVVEDTKYGLEELLALGYSEEMLAIVELVTKDSTLSYEGNIDKIARSGNKGAMMVKFADNYMNFTGDKSTWSETKRIKSQAKYQKSMEQLGAKLGITNFPF